jgi:SAM-dependent methyltransferase
MDHTYPDFFAKYYDKIYHQLRDTVDHAFYLEQIKKAPGRVLETGTGTGRFFSEALEQGADIYGIDISPAMTDILKTKIPARHHHRVSLQNIVDFRFAFSFSLIIAPFRTFMHLVTVSEQLKALKNIYGYLEERGTFIFDAFVPNLDIISNGISEQKDFEAEVEPGMILRRIVNAKSDLIEQITKINFRFEFDDGKTIVKQEWNSCLRLFFRWELEHLLNQSPFKKWEIFGDFNGNPLSKDSKEFIVICKKA